MFCSIYVAQWLRVLASTWRQILSALMKPPGKVNTPMFPEIDTSFLGDAGPLPTPVKPHWSQHVGKVILVRETYWSHDTVKRHLGPVLLVSVNQRKGTLCLQRVIRKDSISQGAPTEKVGPAYHIACRDCQFITVVSDNK